MKRIKVYRGEALVATPEQLFESYNDIEAFMDEHWPDCWYTSELA